MLDALCRRSGAPIALILYGFVGLPNIACCNHTTLMLISNERVMPTWHSRNQCADAGASFAMT
jgi:hypothetical protein